MKLLEPKKIGNLILSNSMAMAPMTRARSENNGTVNDLNVLYYTQRASAGLIITEGINISEQAKGSPFTPGIFMEAQIESWQKVTDAVHQNGGKIFAQLWHTGRVGHSIDRNGVLAVAPSALAIEGQQHFTSQGMKAYEVPRALETNEVKHIVQDYKHAAINAIKAGFDGVELHAATGYLPNQFLAESANQRTDEYGGNIENRSRFILEVMQEMAAAIGEDKVGIKLSPSIPFNSILDSDPIATYSYLIKELNHLPLAYIHLMNALFLPEEGLEQYPRDVMGTLGTLTKHLIIANAGYTRETGEQELEKGIAQIISFGVPFIANPDLPKRFEQNATLNEPDRATFYGGNEKGYTDYPTL
ncbi:alkene reductase [Sphingobacterium alkalisoli]|uniref:Alkene reductase n=1 Tax=Sphingobacterium alkalisoli TaxID=1874115 RepID=A0A4U0H5R7_9SPHI|nr:alkene reductase [Sphingobacterium alkalisoli]TJY67101.1 alkene reductase [Sphingobacterium alkalisoli]